MSVPEEQLARACRIRKQTVEEICRAWNSAGLPYAVLHGLDGYPGTVGRDLDVLILRDRLDDCVRIVRNCMQNAGCVVCIHRRPWAVWIVGYDMSGDVPVGIEIDLLWEMCWGWTRLLHAASLEGPLSRIGPCQVAVEGEFIKTVLFQYLGGNLDRARRQLAVLARREDNARCRDNLHDVCGPELAETIWHDLTAGNGRVSRRDLWKVRVRILLRGLRVQGLRKTMGGTVRWLRNHLGEVWSPPVAPIVALVGPDGVGKSTMIDRLARVLPGLLATAGVEVRHWRPGLLPPLAWWSGRRPEPACAPTVPRRVGGRMAWLRTVYYTLDYLWGYVVRDRPAAGRLKVVLYDRHALDMQVDPVRYGIAGAHWPRLLSRIIPKPHVTIALLADADVISLRKQELTVDELRRQIACWQHLYTEGQVSAVVDCTPDAEEVLARLLRIIVRAQIGLCQAERA